MRCRLSFIRAHSVSITVVLTLLSIIYLYTRSSDYPPCISESVPDKNGHIVHIDSSHPFIFIGGLPRSGTTLLRAMLDVHSQVRCGMETRVLPSFLKLRRKMLSNERERGRLEAAGVAGAPFDGAIASFTAKLLALHGKLKPRLCSKDPYLIVDAGYLSKLFPKSKFVFMIRDGRAFVRSIVKRRITIGEFNLDYPLVALSTWNRQMKLAYTQCQSIGISRCYPVRYEDLVLDPVLWLNRIASFLDIPLEQKMFEPWKYVGSEVAVSLTEKSTDQIRRPIYLSSIDQWVQDMSRNFSLQAPRYAPMLSVLGYDVSHWPPVYGKPNPHVWYSDGSFHPPKL